MLKVTVLIITYNQKEYIADAIESALAQKTSFDYQIIICDDASTDGTADICREYEAKYPGKIQTIIRERNEFSQGIAPGITGMMDFVKTPYLAILEGDDYWINPLKLQKQVDFMDAHTDFTVCYTLAKKVSSDSVQIIPEDDVFCPKNGILPRETFIRFGNQLPTSSVLYRFIWNNDNNIEKLMPRHILPMDWYVHLLYAKYGKVAFIPEITSVYRINPKSVWNGFNSYGRLFPFISTNKDDFLNVFYAFVRNLWTEEETREFFPAIFRDLIIANIFSGRIDQAVSILKNVPQDILPYLSIPLNDIEYLCCSNDSFILHERIKEKVKKKRILIYCCLFLFLCCCILGSFLLFGGNCP